MRTIQESLNAVLGTHGLTEQEAANKLAGVTGARVTTQEALNKLANISGARVTEQEAMNTLAGVSGARITTQEAANKFATNTVVASLAGTTNGFVNMPNSGYLWYGQTFTPNSSCNVVSATLDVSKTEATELVADIYVAIYSTTGTVDDAVPVAQLGITEAIDPSTLPATQDAVTFTFASPVALTAGTIYAVQISVVGGDATNYLKLYYHTPGTDHPGHGFASTNGTVWTPNTNLDLIFSVNR